MRFKLVTECFRHDVLIFLDFRILPVNKKYLIVCLQYLLRLFNREQFLQVESSTGWFVPVQLSLHASFDNFLLKADPSFSDLKKTLIQTFSIKSITAMLATD